VKSDGGQLNILLFQNVITINFKKTVNKASKSRQTPHYEIRSAIATFDRLKARALNEHNQLMANQANFL